jgi:hypothetical protein
MSGIALLALAGFVATVGLVDDVEPATPPHDAIVAMAIAQGSQRILDLHGNASTSKESEGRPQRAARGWRTIKSGAAPVNDLT